MTNRAGDLTIVLTLKDRAAFTRRWMSYADRVALPFKVLIADGGADESVPEMLSDKSRFPNVDYEYVRYAYDSTYADYYAKTADALARVHTPYVALADNDDFFIVNGLRKSVEFLAANPDYVACGGQCAAFWLGHGGAGEAQDRLYSGTIEWKFRQNASSLTSATARERIRLQSLGSDHVFYHVLRTASMCRQFEKIKKANPNDLFLMPQMVSYLSAIDGKIKQLDALLIARQLNSPGSSSGAHQEKSGDWWSRMLVPTWSADFTKFVGTVAAELSATEGITVEEATDCVVESYRSAIAPSLLSDVLEEESITRWMPVTLQLVRTVVRLPENWLKRSLRRCYRKCRWLSLDAVLGVELLAKSSSSARQEFASVREFLNCERT